MLVLTRKEGETIVAGDIEFFVLGIDGNRVRIGIDADESIRVLRGELVDYDEGYCDAN